MSFLRWVILENLLVKNIAPKRKGVLREERGLIAENILLLRF